jgi:hypothetical protein
MSYYIIKEIVKKRDNKFFMDIKRWYSINKKKFTDLTQGEWLW